VLVAKQIIASPIRNFTLVRRLRFQVALMWALAVALPGLYVYLGFITAESNLAIFNSVVSAAMASLIGLMVLRRVNDFPGMRSYSMILPSLAASYGLVLVMIFGLRLVYSRVVLTGSFVVAVLTAFGLAFLTERVVKPLFFVVPGGDADTLHDIGEARWLMLDSPIVPDHDPTMIAADFRYDHAAEWERMLAQAAVGGRTVYHSKLLRESLTGRVTIEHLSENSFGSLLPNLAYRRIKRVVDLVSCVVLLPLLLLPMLLIALLIRLDSPGTIFFRQDRVGYRGEIFRMVKFRSMRPRTVAANEDAAREDAMTRSDDDRITRIGRLLRRTRLDELPQIFNVLRGDMSWIGPRPEAVPLSKWYESEIPFYSYRHIVRPGISGWAQVHQGHVTDLDAINQKLSYDFYYVKYFSAWLDIVIALRTIPIMIGGFGAR
jgi:lipopolysaccharide/colanic/teichoic acid biosynthesis glycosyltransferase